VSGWAETQERRGATPPMGISRCLWDASARAYETTEMKPFPGGALPALPAAPGVERQDGSTNAPRTDTAW
jgi:hypothetical protein